MRIINCIFAIVLFTSFLNAEENSRIPLISVTGTSELNVAPDEIRITINIDNREKLLQEAKNKTDEQARKIQSLAKAHQVKPEDVVTGYVSVSPVRNFRKGDSRTIIYGSLGRACSTNRASAG